MSGGAAGGGGGGGEIYRALRGRVLVGVTRFGLPCALGGRGLLRNELVDEFESKRDLLDTLVAAQVRSARRRPSCVVRQSQHATRHLVGREDGRRAASTPRADLPLRANESAGCLWNWLRRSCRATDRRRHLARSLSSLPAAARVRARPVHPGLDTRPALPARVPRRALLRRWAARQRAAAAARARQAARDALVAAPGEPRAAGARAGRAPLHVPQPGRAGPAGPLPAAAPRRRPAVRRVRRRRAAAWLPAGSSGGAEGGSSVAVRCWVAMGGGK